MLIFTDMAEFGRKLNDETPYIYSKITKNHIGLRHNPVRLRVREGSVVIGKESEMAGHRQLKCEYGTISLLRNNPNVMSDAARMRLEDSIRHRPFMLNARGVVLWQVPSKLAERTDGKTSIFAKQEGRLVVLGGNQRVKALIEQGYSEIPSNWVTLAKKDDGSWWTEAEAEDFVVIDNSPEGMSGENDYDMLMRHYTEERMAAAGIDLANLPLENQDSFAETGGMLGEEGGIDGEEGEKSVEEAVETSEHGERDPALEEWIAKRENVRKDLPEMMETGFYLCLIFETHAQKMEFIEKAGLTGKVSYEMFTDGIEFAREGMGIEIERSGLHFPRMRSDRKLAELAMPNDQEPSPRTVSQIVEETKSEMDRMARCVEWIDGIASLGGVPEEIEARLELYREWAESEIEKAEAMLEACEAARKDGIETEGDAERVLEASEKAKGTGADGAAAEKVAEAFRKALDERAEVPEADSDAGEEE